METSDQKSTWEWTPKRIQNILITAGAVLCGLAAILFAAYAWGHMGLGQRIAALGVVTAATAIGGFAAHRNRMGATAEALTALSLLFAVIDAVGAYRLDLNGIGAIPAWQYTAGVTAGLAAIAGLYRLAVPMRTTEWFAFLAGQVPVPLVIAFGGIESAAAITALIGAQVIVVSSYVAATRDTLQRVAGIYTAGVAGVIMVVFALSTTMDPTNYVDRIAPLFIVAAVAACLGGMANKKGINNETAVASVVTVALAWDAIALIVDVAPQDFKALGVALIGLVTLAAATALKGAARGAVAIVGTSVAGFVALAGLKDWADVANLYTLPVISPWSLGSGILDDGFFAANSTGILGTAFVLIAAAGAALVVSTMYVKDGARATAIVLATAAVSMLPSALGLGLTTAVVTLIVLGVGVVLAGLYKANHLTVKVTSIASGGFVIMQALTLSLAADVTTSVALAFIGATALTITIFDRKVARYASAVGAVTVSMSAMCFATVFGADIALAGSIGAGVSLIFVVASRYLGSKFDTDYATIFAFALAAIGTLMSTGDINALSLSLLSIAGAIALVALRPADRDLAWLAAGVMLMFAWIRLFVADISLVEAYSLPLAGLVLVAGHLIGGRNRQSSWIMYGIGLAIAFIPTLAVLTSDEGITRHIAVGAGALIILMLGTQRRLQAPIVIATAVLLFEALSQFAPYAHAVPRWAGVGFAGVVLLTVGATWESRYRELKNLKGRYESMK